LKIKETLDDSYCISTRIRVARNFSGVPLNTFISKEQRADVEAKAIKAFESFTDELEGNYFSLSNLTEEETNSLI
jgi:protein-arginine kinase